LRPFWRWRLQMGSDERAVLNPGQAPFGRERRRRCHGAGGSPDDHIPQTARRALPSRPRRQHAVREKREGIESELASSIPVSATYRLRSIELRCARATKGPRICPLAPTERRYEQRQGSPVSFICCIFLPPYPQRSERPTREGAGRCIMRSAIPRRSKPAFDNGGGSDAD
jgi:hypothetical protein